MNQSKHTPGAMRAAKRVISEFAPQFHNHRDVVYSSALIIDRETGAGEMLSAIKELRRVIAILKTHLNTELTVGDVLESEELIELTGINPWCVNEGLANREDKYDIAYSLSEIDAAIAKAEAK